MAKRKVTLNLEVEFDDEATSPLQLAKGLGEVLKQGLSLEGDDFIEDFGEVWPGVFALEDEPRDIEYTIVCRTEDETDRYGNVTERGEFWTIPLTAPDDATAREKAIDKLAEDYGGNDRVIPDAYICRALVDEDVDPDISDEVYKRVEAARKSRREEEQKRAAERAKKAAAVQAEANERRERAEYERLKAKYEGK